MSLTSAFQPLGPTVSVSTTPVQVPASSTPGGSAVNFRVRCIATAYLTWGQSSTVTAVGGVGPNTIGMSTGGVESFTFPPQSFFISNVATSFEVTPGDGL